MKRGIILLSVPFFIILACHKKGIPTITTRQEKPPLPQTENMITDIDAGRITFTTRCKRYHDQPDPFKYKCSAMGYYFKRDDTQGKVNKRRSE